MCLGLSALRSGTYHGSHGTSRPGIAFRGQVYQPTEMALVMNGGTVSTDTRHAPLQLHLLPHSHSVHLVDANGPNQLHRTSAVVIQRKDPEQETVGASWSLQREKMMKPSQITVSVQWKLNIINECVCVSLHTWVTFTSSGPSLSCQVVWVRNADPHCTSATEAAYQSTLSMSVTQEATRQKQPLDILWKSAHYAHGANTAFVMWRSWKHPECSLCCCWCFCFFFKAPLSSFGTFHHVHCIKTQPWWEVVTIKRVGDESVTHQWQLKAM